LVEVMFSIEFESALPWKRYFVSELGTIFRELFIVGVALSGKCVSDPAGVFHLTSELNLPRGKVVSILGKVVRRGGINLIEPVEVHLVGTSSYASWCLETLRQTVKRIKRVEESDPIGGAWEEIERNKYLRLIRDLMSWRITDGNTWNRKEITLRIEVTQGSGIRAVVKGIERGHSVSDESFQRIREQRISEIA